LIGAFFREPRLYQLPNKGSRQGSVGLKADGALAGVVILKIVFVRFHSQTTHKVKSAVFRGGPKAY
jgi:hypothetical protein